MIDRSYLPFQSARDYQDPGMQKWVGFFLSEHTSSLSAEKNRVDLSTDLNPVEKFVATFPALRRTPKRLFYGQGEKS